MLNKGRLLIDSLNINAIPWVVYKGKYHCADGFSGEGDVDIFISESSLIQVQTILSNIGFIHFQTQSYYQREGVEDWLALDETTGKLIHIHLHTRIVFGSVYVNQYRFNLEKESLRLAEKDENGVFSQNSMVESLLVLCMFAKKCIDEKKLKKYWRGVHDAGISSVQLAQKCNFLSDLDKDIIMRFINNETLEQHDKLLELFNRFCTVEIRNWRMLSFKRAIAQKISCLSHR